MNVIVSVRPLVVRAHGSCNPYKCAAALGLSAATKPRASMFLSPLHTPQHRVVKLLALTEHAKLGSTPAEPALAASLSKVLKALELLSLATSIGLQGYALLLISRQDAHRTETLEDEIYQAETVPSSIQHTYTQPTRLSHFAIAALILTYFLGLLHRMLSNGRPTHVHDQPQTPPGAGLARVEVLSDRQTQSLQSLQRQLTKVQLKTRLMGHDVRPTLRKVQEENLQQAQIVAKQAEQIEAVNKDLQDTQKLLAALQSVSAKQFNVLLKVMKQQQQEPKPKLQPVQSQSELLANVSPQEA